MEPVPADPDLSRFFLLSAAGLPPQDSPWPRSVPEPGSSLVPGGRLVSLIGHCHFASLLRVFSLASISVHKRWKLQALLSPHPSHKVPTQSHLPLGAPTNVKCQTAKSLGLRTSGVHPEGLRQGSQLPCQAALTISPPNADPPAPPHFSPAT